MEFVLLLCCGTTPDLKPSTYKKDEPREGKTEMKEKGETKEVNIYPDRITNT